MREGLSCDNLRPMVVVLGNGWLGNHGDEAMNGIQLNGGLAFRVAKTNQLECWLEAALGYFIDAGMGQATQFDLIDMVRCTDNGGPLR